MGNEHLTVNIILKDYTVKSDTGSWGLARTIIEDYDLNSDLQLELVGEENNIYVNLLRQRLEQENGGVDHFSQGTVIKIPNSKWQTLVIAGLIAPKPTGSVSPPGEPEAKTVDVRVTMRNSPIVNKLFPQLSMGSRALSEINAIVVHQTNTSTVQQVFNSYQSGDAGSHYVIDLDGTIYKTLEITKIAGHVGRIRSRAYIENNRNSEPTVYDIFFGEGSYSSQVRKVDTYELKKDYPQRYPYNNDSIGIEFVGKFEEPSGYPNITNAQQQSGQLLIDGLQQQLNLTDNDVYRHPEVSYKTESEARSVKW